MLNKAWVWFKDVQRSNLPRGRHNNSESRISVDSNIIVENKEMISFLMPKTLVEERLVSQTLPIL